VLTGFKSGIGLVIVVDQIPKLLGIHIDKTGFLRDCWSIVEHLPQTSLLTLGVSVAIVVLLLGMERFTPRVPAPLVAIAAGIAASALLDLSTAGLTTVGSVPRGLPSWVWPELGLVAQLWPAAAGIALMSFTETIASGRAFARPDEPRPRANRELLAIGVANIGGGLFGAMPAGGGTSQTAVNRSAGARTQFSELVTAATSLATLLLLAPLIALMPNAVLAAVVVVYSIPLIKPEEFRAIAQIRRTEFYWAAVARHPEGHRGRRDRLAARARATGRQSAAARARPQARNADLSRAFGKARGRRDLARLARGAAGGPDLLRQCRKARRKNPQADPGGEAEGRHPRLQSRHRHRVHRAQDARSGRRESPS
jgi:hypothetical protein